MNGTQVRTITAEGLTYLDENGNEAFIDFSSCYQHYLDKLLAKMRDPLYVEQFKQLNHLDDRGLKKSIEQQTKWKEVAQRNIAGDPWGTNPYIEFYTEPVIRFEFSTKDDFWRVRSEVERFGWRTFDLN